MKEKERRGKDKGQRNGGEKIKKKRRKKKKKEFFFFKQKTAYEIKECDWSSDVCSSDLLIQLEHEGLIIRERNGRTIVPVLSAEDAEEIWRDRKSVV